MNENYITNVNNNEKFLIGSTIHCMGIIATIAKVLYAEIGYRKDSDIEFIDTKGNYRHWKQLEDKGYIDCKNLFFDSYGMDMTDTFKKFGYKTVF